MLIWFVAKPTVLSLFWKLVSCTCKNLTECCRNDEDEKAQKVTSDDFFVELTIAPLKTMLDTVLDELENEKARKNDGDDFDKKELKNENPHRYPQEAKVEPNKYLTRLQNRINFVE